MKILNISIFLNQKKFIDLQDELTKNQYEVFDYIFTENTVDYKCYEIHISGLIIDFLPANSFHKDFDYEIGFSFESNYELDLLNNLFILNGFVTNMVKNDNSEYFVLKNCHGPFFFIMINLFSELSNIIKIIININKTDIKHIKKTLRILPKEYKNKIKIVKTNKSYRINKIILKSTKIIPIVDINWFKITSNKVFNTIEFKRTTTAST